MPKITGKDLRRLRKNHGLNQTQMAELLEFASYTIISLMENGRVNISRKTKKDLKRYLEFGIPDHELTAIKSK